MNWCCCPKWRPVIPNSNLSSRTRFGICRRWHLRFYKLRVKPDTFASSVVMTVLQTGVEGWPKSLVRTVIEPVEMTLCTICGGFDRLTTVLRDGLRLNVMPNCYATFARTCYECGFGISFKSQSLTGCSKDSGSSPEWRLSCYPDCRIYTERSHVFMNTTMSLWIQPCLYECSCVTMNANTSPWTGWWACRTTGAV